VLWQVQGGLCATTSIEPLSRIQLWDVSRSAWTPAGTLGEPGMMFANSLSFDKAAGLLVAGCGDRNVRVWDLAT
jgi:WD40 repeat protein